MRNFGVPIKSSFGVNGISTGLGRGDAQTGAKQKGGSLAGTAGELTQGPTRLRCWCLGGKPGASARARPMTTLRRDPS